LGIPGSQIETERIFSVVGILSNLRRSKIGILVMIYKNWPHDCRMGTSMYEHLADFYAKESEALDDDVEVELQDAQMLEEMESESE
jgi:thiol-disulfide isomerase/thioredoxin